MKLSVCLSSKQILHLCKVISTTNHKQNAIAVIPKYDCISVTKLSFSVKTNDFQANVDAPVSNFANTWRLRHSYKCSGMILYKRGVPSSNPSGLNIVIF